MRIKGFLTIFVVMLAMSLLTSCSIPWIDSQEGPSENKILRITESNQISSLDSAKYVDIVSWNVLYNVNEGLMRLGPNNRLVNGMAEEVKISPDKKTYTFKLRDDAEWSDEEPVTAHDFEYAWKRALDPKTKSEYAYILYPIAGAEEYNKGTGSASQVKVKALDEKTLEVRLKQPEHHFLSLTTQSTYFPLRKDIVEKYKDEYTKTPDKMVYNGPFIIQSITPTQVTLVKNETYWDRDTVQLQQVDVVVQAETSKRINLYNAGEADTTKIDSEFVYAYKQTKDYTNLELASSQYLLMNETKSFFKNANIRRAISLAVDRNEIVETVLKDGSKPAGALIPPAMTEGAQSFRKLAGGEIVKHDTALAQAYFNKGLKELGLSRPPDSIVMLCFNDQRSNVAISIKEQLKEKLGLEIKLNALPRKNKVAYELKGEFDMTMSSWFADYSDPIGFLEIWTANSKLNYMKFKNPTFDQLIKKAKSTTSQKEKTDTMIQAEKLLVGTGSGQQAAIVPLYYEVNSFLQKPYVKNLHRHPYGAEYDLKWASIGDKAESQ
ncbi:peptide ABC transporter substrate-binding protein [Laceyella putida]|uniref:Peptide ABC transporter substrate-binding protein n=1 Tax=Laceyella putida TaxID=110101 RepID=A0ABW2RLR0_9BACL